MTQIATTAKINGREFLVLSGEETLRFRDGIVICNKANLDLLFEPLAEKLKNLDFKALTEKIAIKGATLFLRKKPVCMCSFDLNEKKRYKIHLQRIKSSVFCFVLLRLTDKEMDIISSATKANYSLDEFFGGGISSPFKHNPKKDYPH